MKKISSLRCTLCELHVENIPHLFYHCLKVRRVWNLICDVLESILESRIILRCQDVLFGYGFESAKWKNYTFVNNVILNVKAFVWHIRQISSTITFGHLSNWFKEKASIDNSLQPLCEKFQTLDLII